MLDPDYGVTIQNSSGEILSVQDIIWAQAEAFYRPEIDNRDEDAFSGMYAALKTAFSTQDDNEILELPESELDLLLSGPKRFILAFTLDILKWVIPVAVLIFWGMSERRRAKSKPTISA